MLKGLESLKKELESLDGKKEKLNKRLDFLLECKDQQRLEEFREEYENTLSELNQKKSKLSYQLAEADRLTESLKDFRQEDSELIEKSLNAERFFGEDRLKDLRGVLCSLFSRIVVYDKDENGCRKIDFVLKNKNPSTSFDMEGSLVGHWGKLVGPARLELATRRL